MKNIKIYAFADEADSRVDGQIAAMLRNGLAGVEIRGVDGTNISDISYEKAKEVKQKLDENGLISWSLGSPIGKIDIENADFPAHLEKLKHTLEIASILESRNIRIFSFYMPENKADSFKGKVIDYMGKILETAEPYNINLCHENEKGIYGDTPERCLELYKSLPKLKGIFDPANFVQCGVDTIKAWETLEEYICYMHIKDAKWDGTVVPAGFGDGNIKQVASAYIKNGGRNFTMEPHLTVFDGLAKLEREGEKTLISNEFEFKDANAAFDAACDYFKKLIGSEE